MIKIQLISLVFEEIRWGRIISMVLNLGGVGWRA